MKIFDIEGKSNWKVLPGTRRSQAAEMLIQPGESEGGPDNTHPKSDQWLFVLEGTGTAVIVCPGGGYGALAMDKEGNDIARWLNSLGVAAFVLKYRLGPKYRHPIELQDAQRAIRTVRSKA